MVTRQEYEIDIRVDPNGDTTVRPSRKKLKGGDTVHWVSEDGPFAIEFINQTPGEEMGASGHNFDGEKWVTEPLEIRSDACGRFQYAFAVSLPARDGERYGRIALDAGCPEIIVD